MTHKQCLIGFSALQWRNEVTQCVVRHKDWGHTVPYVMRHEVTQCLKAQCLITFMSTVPHNDSYESVWGTLHSELLYVYGPHVMRNEVTQCVMTHKEWGHTVPHVMRHCALRHCVTSCLHCSTLRHTTTYCNTLQHTARHCNTWQHMATHTATHGNTRQHTATHCNIPAWGLWQKMRCNTLATHTTIHCNTVATHCNTLQHTSLGTTTEDALQHISNTHYNTLQYTATHCNTLQHTAIHCNTTPWDALQHYCNTTTTHCKTRAWGLWRQVLPHICKTLQRTATQHPETHRNTTATPLQDTCLGTTTAGAAMHLQHTATFCNILRHSTLQQIATPLQHIATTLQQHCNTTAPHRLGDDKNSWSCNQLQCTATHLQHTATLSNSTHCNTLQHTATHCNTLPRSTTNCDTVQHAATHCNSLQHKTLQHTATHYNTTQCNTLQHNTLQHRQRLKLQLTPTHCNTTHYDILQHCNKLQHDTLKHCNKLQHDTLNCTATNCNALQHTATHRLGNDDGRSWWWRLTPPPCICVT